MANATALETAAAKMDPLIAGIGERVCRQTILENVALYRMHFAQQRKFADEDWQGAGDLDRCERASRSTQ